MLGSKDICLGWICMHVCLIKNVHTAILIFCGLTFYKCTQNAASKGFLFQFLTVPCCFN